MAETAEQSNQQDALDSNAWFFTGATLDELLQDVKPLTSMDELAIDDLSPEEATSFLAAIRE